MSSSVSLISSSLIAEASVISSKESNVNNLSVEKRVNLLKTEIIAMKSFQVLILKQPLKDSTIEQSPSDTSSNVKRLTEVSNVLRQQNESLWQETQKYWVTLKNKL